MRLNILGCVLNRKGSGKPLARRWSAPANRLHAIDFLKVTGGTRNGQKLQPRHSILALLPLWRVRRGRGRLVLGSVAVAKLLGRDIEVKERRGGPSEKVTTADGEIGRVKLGRLGRCQVELHGNPSQSLCEIGIGRNNTRGIKEGGHGAGTLGRLVWFAGIAGVVLGASAKSDMLELESS